MTDNNAWYANWDNIVLLTSYMAENGATAQEVAYAVEKPWKHWDVFTEALRSEMLDETPEG